MDWLRRVERCASARGRACWSRWPTCAGTRRATPAPRWSSAADATWGSVGGGNLEADARSPGRGRCSRRRAPTPEQLTVGLSDKAPDRARRPVLRRRGHGAARAAARRARRRDLRRRARRPRAGADPGPATTSTCTWSTPAPTSSPTSAWRVLADARARVHVHHAAGAPELVLGELPPGTHVLVMTHDHAEDAALCDAALRCAQPGLDRADRLGGEVGAVPRRPRGGGPRRARPIDRITTARSGCPASPARSRPRSPCRVAAALLPAFERADADAAARAWPARS